MPKGIPGCLLITTESDIKLKLSAELTYLGANEYTRLILIRIEAWKFLTQERECRPIPLQFLQGNIHKAEFNK